MSPANLFRLVAVGAIWGSSFAFMRATVGTFGPALLIEMRLLIGAAFLAVAAAIAGRRLEWRRHWRHYARIGAINTAIPFLLFAYAALTLPASLLAVFNSLAPIFGAAIGAWWFGERIGSSTALGLGMGVTGVGVLTFESIAHAPMGRDLTHVALAVAAGVAAPVCYGIGALLLRASAGRVDSQANAQGSLWAALVLLLPTAFTWPLPVVATPGQWVGVAVLGFACTGLAYLLQFRLIAEVGVTRALTVTFLIPVFGVLWGILFLGERPGIGLAVGGPLILLGTAVANGLVPARWRVRG